MSAVVLVLAAALAAIPPAPVRWVEDHAALMSPSARTALDSRLEAYERATGHQLVVWIGKTLDGAPLDDWAVRTFAAWKVGRAGKDDGIVVFVLANDRAIDIEIGYGLEDRVPDAVASRVIHDVMAPRLRGGEADAAITSGAEALITAIEGKSWRPAGTMAGSDALSPMEWVLGGLVGLAMLLLFIKYPRTFLVLLWMFGRGIGGGRGGGGGGRFGGGGGRSGGGGARGGW